MFGKSVVLTLAIGGALLFSGSSAFLNGTTRDAGTAANSRPDFTLHAENGETIRLSKLRGKVVVVNFFGIWCAPCKEELPWFQEFSKKYEARGVVVLGAVEESSSWKRVSPFKQKAGITYTWGMDPDDSFTKFRVEALPSTVVIDRKGNVRYLHTGLIAKDEVEKAIQASL